MLNMVTRSYITSRHGLKQLQGRADFWWAFSGAKFNKGNFRGVTTTWYTEGGVWKGQLQGRCWVLRLGAGMGPRDGNSKHSVVIQVK